jgi:hypothetical protein
MPPSSNDRRDPRAVVLDTIPGEHTRIVWDIRNQTVEYAQVLAARIRAGGAIVVGCSLDELVKRGRSCPVCGSAGLGT